jgi:hypothetical protein
MSLTLLKVGVFGVLILPSLALASTVSVNPATLTVNKGDMFALTIGGTGFTVPPDAGGINLGWDPTILTFGSFKLDPLWVPPSTTGTLGSGTLTHIDFFDNVAPTGPFTIGTINFTALAAGMSAISITEDSLNPFAGAGARITGIAFAPGSVTVNGPTPTVPEPQTAVLVAGALAFIALSYRRRRHSA